MRQGLKLLVLAGSAEARQLARSASEQGAEVRAIVSEPPRGPNPMPVPCDLIEAEDPAALQAAISAADAVLDASHGFDAQMSTSGFHAAQSAHKPFLAFQRLGWPVDAAQGMRSAACVRDALKNVGQGARVFSACGWASLPDCADFVGEVLFLRQTTPHERPAPYPFISLCFGDPPFTREAEQSLFEDLRVDTLICRNLGGQASRPKVDAALALGVSVILIDKPPLPDGAQVVADTADALSWVASL